MRVRIGKISKNEEEYYFAYENSKWRKVKLKDKIIHTLKNIKYMEGELDEKEETLIKRVYKSNEKTVIEYYVLEKGELTVINCNDGIEIRGEKIQVCRHKDLSLYLYDGKYFEDKTTLLNYIVRKIRFEIEKKYNEELIKIPAKLKVETQKAYLLVINGKEVWVPKSVGVYEQNEVVLPYWFVKNNKLVDVSEIEKTIDKELRNYEEDLNALIFKL
jgi:hypothetical protein